MIKTQNAVFALVALAMIFVFIVLVSAFGWTEAIATEIFDWFYRLAGWLPPRGMPSSK